MPDALPQGSFAFLFRQVLLFSVALSCHLPAPYPSLLLQPQRLLQHCIVTASLQISVCAVKASRGKNSKQSFLLSLMVPGTNTVPLLCPRYFWSMAVPQHPHVVYAWKPRFLPRFTSHGCVHIRKYFTACRLHCFHLLCFSKEHTHDWKHTHQPAIADL